MFKEKQILIYKYERPPFTHWDQSVTKVVKNRQEGFYTFIENKNTTRFTDGILFHCRDGIYILQSQICNGKIDCHDGGEDENACICNDDQDFSDSYFCNAMPLDNKQKLCSPLYFITVQGSCHQFDRIFFNKIMSNLESKRNSGLSSKKLTENKFMFGNNKQFYLQ